MKRAPVGEKCNTADREIYSNSMFGNPEVIGATNETLRNTLRTDGAINSAAADALKT
jgi:hypothetical protein